MDVAMEGSALCIYLSLYLCLYLSLYLCACVSI
jgi:hypothetical protein